MFSHLTNRKASDRGNSRRQFLRSASAVTLSLAAATTGVFACTSSSVGSVAASSDGYFDSSNAESLGFTAQGVENIKILFQDMIREGRHPGAQLCVLRGGSTAINFGAGKTNPSGIVSQSTLYQIRSTTKALTTMLMMWALEQGYYKVSDPVAEHWPEFAKNGKGPITIAHVLSHQAGIPDGPLIGPNDLGDRRKVAAAVENMKPVWAAGEANGYHSATIGWVCDELLERWTGKPAHVLFKELFSDSAGASNFFLGLPAPEYSRMSQMEVDPYVRETQAARARLSDFLNTREGIALPLSWVSGVSDAYSLARLTSILAGRGTLDSKKYFSSETQALFSERTTPAGRVDLRLQSEISWGLGLMRGDSKDLYTTEPRPDIVGHAGGGATIGWADPKENLAVAFLTNRMVRGNDSFDRTRLMGDAIYAALS